MVFLSKALILHDSLKQCRIVVVTDRVDLEGKLSGTLSLVANWPGRMIRPKRWRPQVRSWHSRLALVKNV
jgi:hypothetical protein